MAIIKITKLVHSLSWMALLLLYLAGCVEEVDITPAEARLVVINGLLTQEEDQDLSLYWSAGGDSKTYIPITEADVVLTCEGKEVGHYTHKGAGKWALHAAAIPGKTYTLQVDRPDLPQPVTATTTVPEGRIGIYSFPTDIFESSAYVPNVPAVEVVTEDDLSVLWIYADYQPNRMQGDTSTVLATVLGTDHPGTDLFNVSDYSMKEYISLGKTFYASLLIHYPWETLTDYPDDYPLCNRYLRIIHPKDYVQYLQYGGYSVKDANGTEYSLLTGRYSEYVTEVRLFKVTGSFSRNGYIENGIMHSTYTLYVMKVSAELDKYLLSGWSKAMEYLNGDFTMIYDTENTYSNVENGVGIFAGAIRCSGRSGRYYPTLIPGAPWIIK